MVLAATNRPDRVDAALLRPGRFDRLLHVPLPDAAGREAILRIHTRHTPLAPDVDLCQLAVQCNGWVAVTSTAKNFGHAPWCTSRGQRFERGRLREALLSLRELENFSLRLVHVRNGLQYIVLLASLMLAGLESWL